jgi:hypothetical protein
MVAYYPGPYEIEFVYQVNDLNHQQRFNVTLDDLGMVGDDFDSFTAFAKDGSSIQLDTAVDTYIALVIPEYHTSSVWLSATLWEYVPMSYVKEFVAEYEIGEDGTSSSATVEANQETFTYRTAGGSNMRMTLLETRLTGYGVVPIAELAGGLLALGNHFVADTCIFHGRDNTFAASRLNHLVGQNEAVWRTRYRK